MTALDLDTIKAWALIVRLTVAEYLGLDPSLGASTAIGDRIRSNVEDSNSDDVDGPSQSSEPASKRSRTELVGCLARITWLEDTRRADDDSVAIARQ